MVYTSGPAVTKSVKKHLLSLAAFAAAIAGARTVRAADIYVRQADGTNLSSDQLGQVTDMVRRAVRQMPEHTLVSSEDQADFVLQPQVLRRGDQTILRIEKDKDGDVLAESEQPLGSMSTARNRAVAATESALASDRIASGRDEFSSNDGTSSGTSQSAMDDDGSRDNTAYPTKARGVSSDQAGNQPMSGQDPAKSDTAINTTGTGTDTVTGSSPAPDNMAAYPSSNSSSRDYGTGMLGGSDVRAPSPALHRRDNTGTIEVGLGPAFGVGMGSDEPLYDVTAAYVVPFNSRISGKAVTDLNFAAGPDANQFLNFGVGADVFADDNVTIGGAKPYATADVGFAFTRNRDRVLDNAPAVGGGAGFKFAAEDLNFDVNVHYTILVSQVEGQTPSILGLRAAMNF